MIRQTGAGTGCAPLQYQKAGDTPLGKVVEQIIAEIERQGEEIDKLAFGDIVFKIQNGTLIMWDIKKTFKLERPAKTK